jgi:DNA-binding NtrC family response regulator
MPTDKSLASLLARLGESTSFEDAASVVLQAALRATATGLDESAFAGRARVLRAVAHLRPSGSYQRVFGLEHPSGSATSGTGYLASATAWRSIIEHRCPVSVDVHRGSIRQWLSGPALLGDQSRSLVERSVIASDNGTRERLLGRDATHVQIVPLRLPGGHIDGMISIESSCKAAVGQELVGNDCVEQLQLLADLSAPYLVALPLRQSEVARPDQLLPVVGASMSALIALLRVFSRQEETLVLRGPTGVGKSRLARWCHAQSQRASQRFETLDLLSVPEELQMAELFGWKRGAFTGAVKDTQGAITRAQDGTLFLDEIDKLSLKAQAGLLNVLEGRIYRPIGDETGERHANVRFIVGTNADLGAAVRAGRFREDLYYRVNVLPVRIPALDERVDEIPLWAHYMLHRRHGEGAAGEVHLAPDAVELLARSPWPGNLRQLDNILRRAYALAVFESGVESRQLAIERRHIDRALLFEGSAEEGPVIHQLWKAAQSFVQEAERRARNGGTLPLELADAFRGLVLGLAVHRAGDRDGAFRMFAQEHLLKNRNHHRVLRRELDRVRELSRALGDHSSELVALLERSPM